MKKPRDGGVGWSAGTTVVSLGEGRVVAAGGGLAQPTSIIEASTVARRNQPVFRLGFSGDFFLSTMQLIHNTAFRLAGTSFPGREIGYNGFTCVW